MYVFDIDITMNTTDASVDLFRTTPSQINKYSNMNQATYTPPFRVGGRGSKQLSKAIEKSYVEKEKAGESPNLENTWAFCSGSHPCFAKIISAPTSYANSVIIQPMYPSDVDPSLFVPWDGHLWLAKKEKLHPVKVTI
jgi:hypothetical protein